MEASNYNECVFDEENDIDKLKNEQERREKFLILVNPVLEQTKENSFYSALTFAINFNLTQQIDFCEMDQLKQIMGEELFFNLE